MGYTTDFDGSLQLNRPATEQEKDYINLFSSTRRMKRNTNKLMELYHGEHGNPFATEKTPEAIYGNDGEYFARDDGNSGQDRDASILDNNMPPGQFGFDANMDFMKRWRDNEEIIMNGGCQPSLWCDWCITKDGTELEWNGGEKFYHYVEWLKYLINHFFSKWGILLNGEILWEGEDSGDRGKIIVKNNVVTTKIAKIVYE